MPNHFRTHHRHIINSGHGYSARRFANAACVAHDGRTGLGRPEVEA